MSALRPSLLCRARHVGERAGLSLKTAYGMSERFAEHPRANYPLPPGRWRGKIPARFGGRWKRMRLFSPHYGVGPNEPAQ